MKQVFPKLDIEYFEPQPEEHVGWFWEIKMREGIEEAEDTWVADRPRDAIAKAKVMYPDAKLVSCHRRGEVTTWSAYCSLMDGRVR